MKRVFLALIGIFATLVLSTSCEEKPPVIEMYLDLDVEKVEVSDLGGNYDIMMSASHDWTATTTSDWVNIKTPSGQAGKRILRFSVDKSSLERGRTTKIVVTSELASITKEIAITQAAMSAERIANHKIYYTTTDGKTIKPLNPYNVFNGPTIASNTYSNGQGVMTLTDEVVEIGTFAFSEIATLKTMKLPKSVKVVGYNTFLGNPNMTEIELNEGLESIDVMAFARCPMLTEVKIPQSVKKMGMAPFAMCPALERFEGKFVVGDGRYLVYNNELIGFAPAGMTECVVPEGVVAIQQEVLKECRELTSVKLPNGLTRIEVSSLRNCESLLSIEFPSTIKQLGMGAFHGCKSLTSVVLPENLTTVEMSLFEKCTSLAEVEIGSKVTLIEGDAFSECALTTVVCKAATPPATEWNVFGDATSDLVIKVPAASVAAYEAAECWKEYTIKAIE